MKNKVPDSKERLQHVIAAIENIREFCYGKTFSDIEADKMLFGAILYQFMIIGEAIVHVDTDVLKKYNYPWHLPRSFRNYITHEYFGILPERVWDTIEEQLPALYELVQQIIKKEF